MENIGFEPGGRSARENSAKRTFNRTQKYKKGIKRRSDDEIIVAKY